MQLGCGRTGLTRWASWIDNPLVHQKWLSVKCRMMVFMCFRANTPYYELWVGLGSWFILGEPFARRFLQHFSTTKASKTRSPVTKLVKCTPTSSSQHGHSDSEPPEIPRETRYTMIRRYVSKYRIYATLLDATDVRPQPNRQQNPCHRCLL